MIQPETLRCIMKSDKEVSMAQNWAAMPPKVRGLVCDVVVPILAGLSPAQRKQVLVAIVYWTWHKLELDDKAIINHLTQRQAYHDDPVDRGPVSSAPRTTL